MKCYKDPAWIHCPDICLLKSAESDTSLVTSLSFALLYSISRSGPRHSLCLILGFSDVIHWIIFIERLPCRLHFQSNFSLLLFYLFLWQYHPGIRCALITLILPYLVQLFPHSYRTPFPPAVLRMLKSFLGMTQWVSLGLFLRVWNKFITLEFERILEKQANKTNNHNKVKQNKNFIPKTVILSLEKRSSSVLHQNCFY